MCWLTATINLAFCVVMKKIIMSDIPEHLRRHPPPVGLGEMKCELCEHWTTRHAPIERKKTFIIALFVRVNVHFPIGIVREGLYWSQND